MSREIKFRAWDKETGLWYGNYGESFTLKDAMGKMWRTGLDRLEFMQYTGLKDKNGKEIYEGDIVRKTWGWKTSAGEDDHADALVVIEHSTCGIRWLPPRQPEDEGFKPLYNPDDDPEHTGELAWDLSEFEVIGNNWEHPELLGDTKA
jgi:uncharacterized phage protein (TIGR01671 family)